MQNKSLEKRDTRMKKKTSVIRECGDDKAVLSRELQLRNADF